MQTQRALEILKQAIEKIEAIFREPENVEILQQDAEKIVQDFNATGGTGSAAPAGETGTALPPQPAINPASNGTPGPQAQSVFVPGIGHKLT